MTTLRFEIANDCLYAANKGRGFDRTGVISVCAQHLSAKASRASRIETPDCADEALVEEIQRLQVEIYRINPNQLLADRNDEEETSSDYAGRCVLELLQNADDAMAPEGASGAELIGAKGLGFKSVLELTDTPQIFSGPYSFGFDQARSRALLADLSVSDEVGVFRIPHAVPRDAIVEQLLKAGFASVIRLPLRDAAARSRVEQELAELQPHFLLLSQHLECVEIRANKLRRELSRQGARGAPHGADAKLEVRAGDRLEHASTWRVWRDVWPAPSEKLKRLSITLAFETTQGKLKPTEAPIPVHVFYPTEDQIGAHFLLHGAFDVTPNRQRVRGGPRDADLLARLGEMVTRIARSVPAIELLDVFRELIASAPRGAPKLLPRRMQQAIRSALIEVEFVPVLGRGKRLATPHEARRAMPGFAKLLNPAARGVADAKVARPELEPVFQVIEDLDGTSLTAVEHAELMRHVRCGSIAECLTAARIMQRVCLGTGYVAPGTIAALKYAPIFAIEDGTPRALVGTQPLLLNRPPDWPNWCNADALHPELAAALFPNGVIGKEWERLVGGVLLRTPAEQLEHCFAPSLGRWDEASWAEHGYAALELVERWANIGEWSKIKPYAPQAKIDNTRQALVDAMRVPTGKTWAPARTCYARAEIRGSTTLTRYFKPVLGRALCGYPSEAKRRFSAERWRALLRYLGVSWEPKILLMADLSEAVLDEPDSASYENVNYHRESLRYLKLDWYLEGFPDCVVGTSPAMLMEMVSSLHRVAGDLEARWHKVANTDATHVPSRDPSFVHHQLRETCFLPVKPSIMSRALMRGREAFWPGTGVRGITPELDLAGFNDPRRGALRPAIVAMLRLRTKLPEDWTVWLSWNESLCAAVEHGAVPRSLATAREFYERMLETGLGRAATTKPASLVCSDPSAPSGLTVVPRAEACWIDRPALASPEVLIALSAAGLRYLPALLGAAPDAVTQLGIEKASEKVSILPSYDEAAPKGQALLERRLEARWRAIAAQCEAKRARLPTKPKLRAVHGLSLNLSLNGKPVTQIASIAFRQGDEWLIDLGHRWEGIALALTDGAAQGADLRYRFAAVLTASSKAAVERLLQEDGIPSYKLAMLRLDDDAEEEPELDIGEAGEAMSDNALQAANDEGEQEADPAPLPNPPPPPLTPPERPAGNQFANGSLRPRPLYDPPSEHEGGGGARNGIWGNQAAAGMAGERWLRDLMLLGLPKGWSAALNERDAAAGESDIVVRSPSAEWHVEVKTLSSERLYWSMLEKAKAERQKGCYWMCFLVRQGYAWRIHWSFDPLVDLLACERRMEWRWDSEREGPKLAVDGWQPISGTSMPQAEPDSATIVIRMLEAQLRALPEDSTKLNLFWKRARGVAPKRAAT
jgi:hypothetical protein